MRFHLYRCTSPALSRTACRTSTSAGSPAAVGLLCLVGAQRRARRTPAPAPGASGDEIGGISRGFLRYQYDVYFLQTKEGLYKSCVPTERRERIVPWNQADDATNEGWRVSVRREREEQSEEAAAAPSAPTGEYGAKKSRWMGRRDTWPHRPPHRGRVPSHRRHSPRRRRCCARRLSCVDAMVAGVGAVALEATTRRTRNWAFQRLGI